MRFLTKLVIVTTVITVGIGYYLNPPIPDGYSEPSTLRPLYWVATLSKTLASIGKFLHLAEDYEIRRNVYQYLAELGVQNIGDDPTLKISDSMFDGVPVRIYIPVNKGADSPGFVYYHGGGWILGSPILYEMMMRRLASSLNAVFVSVDYRLAPEHPFPVPFDDCVTATKYFLENAADFGVDPSRVGIGGDSSGGNLAAAVALKLRDDKRSLHNGPKLQVLFYPVTQALDMNTPSYHANRDDAILTPSDMVDFFSLYILGHRKYSEAFINNEHTSPAIKQKMASSHMDVSKLPPDFIKADYVSPNTDHGDEKLFNELKDKLLNPYLSPLVADDLSNLPKAYVLTCGLDVLRDDGVWYAMRLKEARVEVLHVHVDIGFHGLFAMHSSVPEATFYFEQLISYLRENL